MTNNMPKTNTNTTPLIGEIVKPSKVRIDPKKLVKNSKGTDIRYKKFVKAYKETGNGTKSAIAAGYSERSAAQQASYLLKHPKVLAILNDSVEEAEEVIRGLIHSDDEKIQLAAAKEVLDRTIGKPIQRSENVSVNITVETMLETSDK